MATAQKITLRTLVQGVYNYVDETTALNKFSDPLHLSEGLVALAFLTNRCR